MSPSSSSSEPSTPDQIYSSSLDSLGLGHALWEPEPNDTGEVQFGDVGFVHEGSFVRLFNLDPSVEEWKVTRWNPAYAPQALPENALKIKRNPHKLASGHYCSHGVYSTEVRGSVSVAAGAPVSAGLEVGYICSAKQGAALRLRSDARAEGIYPSPRLRRYIARHYDQWLAYARDDADHDVKHGDLVVVTSCAKTTPDWATCVFSSRSSGLHVSLAGHAGGVAGVAAGGAHETSVTHTPIQRRGELYHAENRAPGDARGRSDQCVTIKRLKVRKRWFIRLVAAADDHELPSPDDKLSDVGQQTHPVQEGIEIAASENQDTSTDFLDTLLAYELDVSGARVAIAGDDEVEALLNGLSVADFASYLRSAQPRVHVDEDGIASLMMHGLIVHELDQRFSRLDVSAGVTESPGMYGSLRSYQSPRRVRALISTSIYRSDRHR
ncbi:WD40 repeat domain-containing protein [Phanerochaete sordida]|uniref:WD40 repeat domain-containing protein n=1 Tax=Phanerochaete sordida TaxID=48140 RepID=A0A9P3LHN6_9APHY|nr:WD40 repeat domain-containing protein [Phanerochaete sordida]